MRSTDANGAEHTLSVGSLYVNDRSSYANVRSSYANDRHTSPGYWHTIVNQMSNLCCVFHIDLRNKKTNTIRTIFIRYLLTIATVECLYMFYYVKRCSILLANRYHRWMYWFSKICFSIWNTLYSWKSRLIDYFPCYQDYIVSMIHMRYQIGQMKLDI